MNNLETLSTDTASDDSNYETLCSEPSEINVETSAENLTEVPPVQQAPSRPVPPPPRESSLTETFGKRIKMLRRTWSITKGSLGRMRRKSSATSEIDVHNDETGRKSPGCENCHSDSRKTWQTYNFIKHFQKNVSHSTFYLDNQNEIKGKNNNGSIDEIYGNTNWIGGNEWQGDSPSIGRQVNNSGEFFLFIEYDTANFVAFPFLISVIKVYNFDSGKV